MFFNHPREQPETREPKSVFARIDRIEDAGAEDEIIVLDCLDTWWLDEAGSEGPPFAERFDAPGPNPDNALSVITTDAKPMRDLFTELDEGQWYLLELGRPEEPGWIVDQYLALFSEPNSRGVITIEPVPDHVQHQLDYLAGWGGATPSSRHDIEAALYLISEPDAVAIYDVGQGAASALINGGVPSLYFDFGGSAIGNWRSFPAGLHDFCFTNDPPIILSHWDWDHWSSAIRDRRSLKQTWVLPLQQASGALGAVHSRFLFMLNQSATVLWWDPSLMQLSLSGMGISIVKAAGPSKNRNESGLALVVEKSASLSKSVLLPGDASFSNLYPRVGKTFDHVAVPHHGGKTDLTLLPTAKRKTKSNVIYSYGVGNIFLHPRDDTIKAFRKGWKKNAHTALRNDSGFGHIGIDLKVGRQARRKPPCNGSCQLTVQHWI